MPQIRAELLEEVLIQPGLLLHDPSQVVYLPFDKDVGIQAWDRSAHGHHGTLLGPSLAAGKVGNAQDFDGVDDRIRIDHHADLQINTKKEISFSLWFYPRFQPGSNCLFYKVGEYLLYGLTTATKRLQWLIVADGGWKYGQNPYVGTSAWHHAGVGAKHEGTDLLLRYVFDGVDQGDAHFTITSPDATTNHLFLGPVWTNYYYGLIDEFRIFNRLLRVAEFIKVMNMRGI